MNTEKHILLNPLDTFNQFVFFLVSSCRLFILPITSPTPIKILVPNLSSNCFFKWGIDSAHPSNFIILKN